MNILLTGGGMRNKGAQSMTYIVVDELRRRYPDDNIILLFPDAVNESEFAHYQFSARLAKVKSLYYLIGGIKKIISILKNVDMDDVNALRDLFANTRMLVDISGYALSSRWGMYIVRFYLSVIQCAKRFQVPVYIMPQSFGPFGYAFPKSLYMNRWIRKTMQYPRVIFARENDGYRALTAGYGLSNVKLSHDLVIVNKEVSLENVFKTVPVPRKITVKEHAVAILPNVRLLDICDETLLMDAYGTIIDTLTKQGRFVYILHHSSEDCRLADEIYERFADNGSVLRIAEDLDCFEYEDLIKQFDFIIASRYHSIVHAYRQQIPCIAIGWAIKYYELLKSFCQEQYAFDVVAGLDTMMLQECVERLSKNYRAESQMIAECLDIIHQENIFAVLDKDEWHE